MHPLVRRANEAWRQRYRDVLEDTILVNRHNKTALGWSKTWTRRKSVQKRKMNRKFALPEADFLAMIVQGTMDELRNGKRYFTEHGVCACCGQSSPKMVKLNDRGKRRLQLMRRKYGLG